MQKLKNNSLVEMRFHLHPLDAITSKSKQALSNIDWKKKKK